MRALPSIWVLSVAIAMEACSSLNQGVLDAASDGPGADGAADATADVTRADAPESDAVDAPALVDAVDAPALVDAVDAPVLVDAVDAPALVDAVDAPALDAMDVPSVDAPDVRPADAPDAVAADVPRVDAPRFDVVDAAPPDVTDAAVADSADAGADAGGAPDCGVGRPTCAGRCVDPLTDLAHCGACGTVCPSRPNAAPRCTAGACGLSCATGFANCNGLATDGCEVDTLASLANCGACNNACPSLPNSTPQCFGGACRLICAPGFGDCNNDPADGCETNVVGNPRYCGACNRVCGGGTGCAVSACVNIPTPRPLSPLSTSTVTTTRPTVRWANLPGATGAVVYVADNPGMLGARPFAATQASSLRLDELTPGVWYWYAQGVSGTAGNTGAQVSPVWQFVVPNRDSRVDRSFGVVSDFNRDGYGDLAAGLAGATSGYPSSSGRVRIYLSNPGGVASLSTVLYAGGPETNSAATVAFGTLVATGGDTNGDGYPELLATARSTDGVTGQVLVFRGSNTGVSVGSSLVFTAAGSTPEFGRSISAAGDVNGDGYGDVVVGARGQAHVLYGSASGLVGSSRTVLTGSPGDDFGFSVAGAGDVNGDGFGDVLVGEPGFGGNTGRFHLYLGGATGIATAPDVSRAGNTSGGRLGYSVACAGDLNGDGYADVAVGAPSVRTGEVLVIPGSYAGLLLGSALSVAPTVAVLRFGASLAGVGDADLDGYDDLLVGAPGSPSTLGAAHLLRGREVISVGLTPFVLEPSAAALGNGAEFGAGVSGVGDADHDGYMDFVVGAPCAPFGPSCGTGRVFFFRGAAQPPSGAATSIISTNDSRGDFGRTLARSASWLSRVRQSAK